MGDQKFLSSGMIFRLQMAGKGFPRGGRHLAMWYLLGIMLMACPGIYLHAQGVRVSELPILGQQQVHTPNFTYIPRSYEGQLQRKVDSSLYLKFERAAATFERHRVQAQPVATFLHGRTLACRAQEAGHFGAIAGHLPDDMRVADANYAISNLDIEHGLASNFVSTFYFAPNGDIWIGYATGGISCVRGQEIFHIGEREGIDNAEVTSIQGFNGAIWVGTFGSGLYRVGNGRVHHYHIPDSFPTNHVLDLEVQNGALWIGSYGAGLLRFDGHRFTQFAPQEGVMPARVPFLCTDQERGELYYTNETDQVFRLGKNGRVASIPLTHCLPPKSTLSGIALENSVLHAVFTNGRHIQVEGEDAWVYASPAASIYSTILCSPRGGTWIGANDGSLWRADGDILKGITHAEGLSKSRVQALGVDANGNIWLGSARHGIFVLAHSPFRTIIQEENDLYAPIDAIAPAPGGILVPTAQGLSLLDDEKLLTLYIHPALQNLSGMSVVGQRIWASSSLGLIEISNDSVFVYRERNDPTCAGMNTNLDVLPTRDGRRLLVANYNYGYYSFDLKTHLFTYFNDAKDFSLTNSTYEDSHGRIWIASPTAGICFVEGNRRTTLQKGYGEVYTFAEDKAGNIWIGTSFGLLQYSQEKKLFIHEFLGQRFNNEIRALLYLPSDNTLWIGSARGLMQYSPALGRVRRYRRAQGISGNYFTAHAAISTQVSSFWANNKGLLQHDWGTWANERRVPTLHLASIDLNVYDDKTDWLATKEAGQVDFDSLEWGLPVNLRLSEQIRQLEFHFSTGSWFAAENMILSYRIGEKGEWIRSYTQNAVALYGLKSMSHDIYFKVTSADGVDSVPVHFSFQIRKPFYLELWFMLVVAIIGGVLGYFGLKQAFRIRFENARSYSDQDAYLKRVRLLGAIMAIGIPLSELTETSLDIPGYKYASYTWMAVCFLLGIGLWFTTYVRRLRLETLRQLVEVICIGMMLMITIRTQQSDYAPTFTIGFIVIFSFASVILDNIRSFLRFCTAVGMMLAYTFVWIDTTNSNHLLFLTNFPLAFLFGGIYHVLQLYKISNLLFGDQILSVYDKYVLVSDPEGRIVYCNDYVLDQLNLPEEYLLGEGWWEITGVRKMGQTAIREAIRARIGGDQDVEVFANKLIKPGRKQPCALEWEYQVIESGYLMGIGTDVSERVEQEAMIRTLSLIAATTENMVVITDVERKIEWVNSSFSKATDYTFEEVLGQNLDDLLQGPQTDASSTQAIRDALKEGKTFRGELVNYAKSGRPYWVMIDIQPILDENDQVHKYVSLSIDITEKKMRELEMLKTIQEGEEKYKLIAENTSDGIAILDAEGHFVFTSPSYLNILGYSFETHAKADAASIAALIHPEDREIPFRAHREAIARHREHALYTYRVRHRDGHYVWKEDSATFIYDADQKHQKTYIIGRDITQRVQKEEEREQLLKELTYSFDELQQFSFITQHNLRAPVANFLSLIEQLEQAQIDHPMLPKFISAMRVTAEGFDQTIRDLNTVLSVKNRSNVTFQALHLQTSLQAVLEVHSEEILAVNPRITTDFAAAPVVRFNTQYMHSIFSNLITNALKFRAEGRQLEISISSRVEGRMVRITFADNGIGLDLKKFPGRIFGLYQRFHDDLDGKGFGLYLLRSQVESAGGHVSAESALDEGFKVHMWLPSMPASV